MKGNLYDTTGAKKSQIELPAQFSEPVRKDLIKRAVVSIQTHNRQKYGADPNAGTKQGGATPKRRHKHGTTYGFGVSRIKRKVMWKRGGRFGWEGAFVANAKGGRKAFPPVSEKDFVQKINTKERRKAIRSAIAATADESFVIKRGHKIAKLSIPIIIDSNFEEIKKTKEVLDILEKIGLSEEIERTSEKKVRAGKGTMRGRKYKSKKGPLVVAGKKCSLLKSAKNIPGVDVAEVKSLNAELLAPGTEPGRLVIWTKSAIEALEKERLFM